MGGGAQGCGRRTRGAAGCVGAGRGGRRPSWGAPVGGAAGRLGAGCCWAVLGVSGRVGGVRPVSAGGCGVGAGGVAGPGRPARTGARGRRSPWVAERKARPGRARGAAGGVEAESGRASASGPARASGCRGVRAGVPVGVPLGVRPRRPVGPHAAWWCTPGNGPARGQGRPAAQAARSRRSPDRVSPVPRRPTGRQAGRRAMTATRSLSTRLSSASASSRSRFRHSTTEPPVASGPYNPALSPSQVS